jgi:hypothetical protein
MHPSLSMRIGDAERTDIPPGLAEATAAFLEAGRRYREFLKRHYRDRLAGVVYVESEDGEMVLYTESQVYAGAIKGVVLPFPSGSEQ